LQEKFTVRVEGKKSKFHKNSGGIIKFRDKIFIPTKKDMRKLILEEILKSSLGIRYHVDL